MQSALVDALRHGDAINDRKLLVSKIIAWFVGWLFTMGFPQLEHILSFVSKLEDGMVSHALKSKIIEFC